MKRTTICFCIIALFLSSSFAYAGEPIEKVKRGAMNIISCPFEIGNGMKQANEQGGIGAAYSWGIVNGILRMGLRAIVGVYELVTFPIPIPKDYEPIMTDPEYFFES
ncbi:MAG: exosortase system-associated protein, TIGR04073 family [Candidatus Omnitrophota bacterium]